MAHLEAPVQLDYSFIAPIGVDVKGEEWSCVEVPDAPQLLGTRAAVRVDAEVDGIALSNIGLMPTGRGGLMLSISAVVRKKLGKEIGDTVNVTLLRRLT